MSGSPKIPKTAKGDEPKAAPLVVLRGNMLEDRPRPRRRVPFNQEQADEICWYISLGASLRQICTNPSLPSIDTVLMWTYTDEGFSRQYAKARERQMDAYADRVIEISEDSTLEPNDRRVRIDAIRWITSKLAPKRYGDKIVHSGDAENPIRMLHASVDLTTLSNAEIDALEQFTTARLEARDAETEDVDDGGATK